MSSKASRPVQVLLAVPILDPDKPRRQLVDDTLSLVPDLVAHSGFHLSGLPQVDTTVRGSQFPGMESWDGDLVVARIPVAPPPSRPHGASGPRPDPNRLDPDMIEARFRGEQVRLTPREKHAAIQIGLYQDMPVTVIRQRLRLSGAEFKRYARSDWMSAPGPTPAPSPRANTTATDGQSPGPLPTPP